MLGEALMERERPCPALPLSLPRGHFPQLAMVCLVLGLQAAGNEDSPLLPSATELGRYENLLNQSLFHREVYPKIKNEPTREALDFNRILKLEGIVEDPKEGVFIYVQDRSTEAFFSITEAENQDHGLRVVSATITADPQKTRVTLQKGTETGELRYPNEGEINSAIPSVTQPPALANQRSVPGVPPSQGRPEAGGNNVPIQNGSASAKSSDKAETTAGQPTPFVRRRVITRQRERNPGQPENTGAAAQR